MKFFNTALKMVAPNQLDRRTVLKGVTLGAGAVVLQPFLNRLEAQARGEAPSPKIVFVIEGNGMYSHHIRPNTLGRAGYRNSETDRLVDASLNGHELPDPIAPLAPYKDRTTILLGISGKNLEPNHGAGFGTLGCYNAGRSANGGSNEARFQTVDHALAARLSGIIPVVGLGVYGNPGVVFANTVSASDRRRPLPMMCQPEVAFRTLFGSVAEGNAAQSFNARNRLLDWCRTDIRRVRSELPTMDREMLDVYLSTFEQMRSREDRIAALREPLRTHRPASDRFSSAVQTDRFEAHCALATSALASGLTNVVVLDASCGPHNYKTWRELGVTLDGHSIGHMAGQPGQEQHSVPIRRYHAARVADLARRFQAIREGNGTMLDNTLIIYMSDAAEDHHGQGLQWPMVLVGNLGGRLRTNGRFLQFPSYNRNGHRTLSNLYLSLLHAVGDRRERFGDPDPGLRDINIAGPLTEILA